MLLGCRCYLSLIFFSGAFSAYVRIDEAAATSSAEKYYDRTVAGAVTVQTPAGIENAEMPKNTEPSGERHSLSIDDTGRIDPRDSSQWSSALNMSSELQESQGRVPWDGPDQDSPCAEHCHDI